MKPLSYFKTSKELLDKSLRELARLQNAIDESKETEIGDCIFNFCVTTYHIKDWLIQKDRIDKNTVVNFMKDSEWLNICRDICNSGKHFTIDRYEPVAGKIHEVNPPSIILTNSDGKQIEIKNRRIEIHTIDGKIYELLELAYQAFTAWELFFSKEGKKE